MSKNQETTFFKLPNLLCSMMTTKGASVVSVDLCCLEYLIPMCKGKCICNKQNINHVLIHVNQVASEVLEGEKAAVASGILEASVTSKVSEGSVVLEARPNQETRNLLG